MALLFVSLLLVNMVGFILTLCGQGVKSRKFHALNVLLINTIYMYIGPQKRKKIFRFSKTFKNLTANTYCFAYPRVSVFV